MKYNSHNSKKSWSSLKSEKFGWRDKFSEVSNTLENLISKRIKFINGLILRNKGRGLIGILLKYTYGVRSRSSKSVVRQVAGFVFYICKMASHSGLKGVVIYLKACQVLLQQSVGGYRVVDLADLKVRPRRNKAGLPLLIPSGVRARISRDRDIPSIRLWMTLFGLFRILEFKGKLTLDTITDPGVVIPNSFMNEWENFLTHKFKPQLLKVAGKLPALPQPTVFPILKSGPTTFGTLVNSSPLALIRAARVWLVSNMKDSLKVFCFNLGIPALYNRLELVAMADESSSKLYKELKEMITKILNLNSRRMYPIRPLLAPIADGLAKGHVVLGKLGFKIEPAGKIRVFAMVDAWTQWLMYPLHKWIFTILRKVHQDGTFNQMLPVEALQQKYSLLKKNTFSSIDLSAATDRLPISLQVLIIKVLFKELVPDSDAFSKAWRDLLVKRGYLVSPGSKLRKECIVPDNLETIVTYEVGQPMGALSSWAMLALTHHAIVQYCYYKAYGVKARGWFENYGVLGDDIIIADGRVAEEYRRFLQIIGVKAGLAKSIIAKCRFVVEFAKKFFVDDTTANMLPLKECIATLCSTSLVVEFVRKYDLSLNAILSFLGFGYKTKMKAFNNLYFKLSTRLRVVMIWLTHPSSPLGYDSYKEWLFQCSWKKFHYPKESVLLSMVLIARGILADKLDRQTKYIEEYMESIENDIVDLDDEYPIQVTAQISSSMDSGSIQKRIPWKAIINPDMKTSPEEEYDFLTGGMSVHSLRFKNLEDIKLGVEPDWVSYDKFEDLLEYNLLYNLEETLSMIFNEDDISSQIPKKFFQESREKLRPFSDFLETYQIWQKVTKPLWADLYKGLTGLELVKRPNVKLKDQVQPDRDDLECLPTSLSLWKRVINRLSNIFNNSQLFCLKNWNYLYCYFLREGNLLIFVLGFVLGWLLMGHLYTDSHHIFDWDPVILWTEDIEDQTEQVLLNCRAGISIGLWLIVGGVLVILLSLCFDYYILGLTPIFDWSMVTNPVIITEDPIQRFDLGLPGPYTALQLEVLQDYLAVKAFEDNLALSPIGDLWISPWLE